MRAEKVKESFDFVITRAVAPMIDLVKWTRKKYINEQSDSRKDIENGVIALKWRLRGWSISYSFSVS